MKIIYTTFFITLLFVIINSIFFSSDTISYSNLPPNDRVNRPGGGGNCTTCHGSNPLNSGVGSVILTVRDSLNNIVTTYRPNRTYNLNIQVAQTGVSKYGFELASTTNGGSTQAGTLISASGTGIGVAGSISYIKHSPANATGSWDFKWQAAPSITDNVTFYFVGNATNGNNNPSGDFVYANSLTLPCSAQAILYIQDTMKICDYYTTYDLQNIVQPSSDSGTWSGEFITNNIFNITAAGLGNHTAIFTAGAGNCTDTKTITIQVTSVPTLIIGADSICPNEIQTYYTNYQMGAVYFWTVMGGTILNGGGVTDTTITILWGDANGTINLVRGFS